MVPKAARVGSPSCRMFDAFMLELMLTLLPSHAVVQALCSRVDCCNEGKNRMEREDPDESLEQPCNLDMQPTSRLLPNLLLALEQMLYTLVYREVRNGIEHVETN